jgi:trimeric autotransporter adhesin
MTTGRSTPIQFLEKSMTRFKAFRFLTVLLALLAPAAARSAGSITTATITVTNSAGTTNGQTITVNADVRTWTNSVTLPISQIATNATIGGAATNLFNAVADAPFANLSLAMSGTNGITLQSAPNGVITVTLSPGWGSAVLTTNVLGSGIVMRMANTIESAGQQTNLASLMALSLEKSTNALSATDTLLSNYESLSQAQTVTGAKTFASFSGTAGSITNAALLNPTLTNGINYGTAFASPGPTGNGSQQFGGASATNDFATAVGILADAWGTDSSAFGFGAHASGANATAIGVSAQATGDHSTAVGKSAAAAAPGSTALGQSATVNAFHTNSTAIGYNATTTGTNQLMLGSAGISTVVNNVLTVGGGATFGAAVTNLALSGQTSLPAGTDVSFGRFPLTTLANGNNAGIIVGTNVFVELSGPSGVFTINGIAGGSDGKFLILLNRTGQNLTIAHDSGVDATPANRIYCLTGADKTVTGNSAALLIYNGNVSRWILLNFAQ